MGLEHTRGAVVAVSMSMSNEGRLHRYMRLAVLVCASENDVRDTFFVLVIAYGSVVCARLCFVAGLFRCEE